MIERKRKREWNVTPYIWQASNFYFFSDLYCSRIAQNTRFAAQRRREAREGYFDDDDNNDDNTDDAM